MLSADEVVRFLEVVSSPKSWAALMIAYAVGLRISEVIGIKVDSIDSQRIVKARAVAPSVILKELAAFPRRSRFHVALSELAVSSAQCSCSIGRRVRNFAGAVMPA
ncbi:tyrosine-type recombinase/integrase [Methylocapsa aurea]|uniref:tyrosine-type recombinase/integrase n=1 Tax=Methylocapsa aurea TaxID=663610 RepID=UPI000689377E|nr:tyrosine-type recombinase/integrase [Methylocapsa aurea]